jgi:hypothetical protein
MRITRICELCHVPDPRGYVLKAGDFLCRRRAGEATGPLQNEIESHEGCETRDTLAEVNDECKGTGRNETAYKTVSGRAFKN